MRYNGLYFSLFRGTMKKVLTERYGKDFARKAMRKAAPLYQRIVRDADDLGKGNPMAVLRLLYCRRLRNPYGEKWGERAMRFYCIGEPENPVFSTE